MAYYVPYYGLVAAPLHKLTRKREIFPSGSKWIPGSDYDMAFHHVRSLMLDRPLYILNKDNSRHLLATRDGTARYCYYRSSTVNFYRYITV